VQISEEERRAEIYSVSLYCLKAVILPKRPLIVAILLELLKLNFSLLLPIADAAAAAAAAAV
jgi:hypothetical protein